MDASTDRSTIWLCRRKWSLPIIDKAIATETAMTFRLDKDCAASGYRTVIPKSEAFNTRAEAVEAGRAWLVARVEAAHKTLADTSAALAEFNAKESQS